MYLNMYISIIGLNKKSKTNFMIILSTRMNCQTDKLSGS